MDNLATLLERNRAFAEGFNSGDLVIRARLATLVVTCLDARVDPAHFLGLELGDALVIRNAGGRINSGVLRDMGILGVLGASVPGPGMQLQLVLIQHTDCGMARFASSEVQALAVERLALSADEAAALAITDPAASVRADIERLRATPGVPDQMVVSGFVYDVTDGSVTEAVAPGTLR